MDADIFVSGKKKLRIQKYPDTCGRGLSLSVARTVGEEEVRSFDNIMSTVLETAEARHYGSSSFTNITSNN